MKEDLTSGQLRRALRATYQLADVRELTEFPSRVATLLRELIPAELAGYNALDLQGGRATVVADPADSVFDGGREELARFAHQNPMVAHLTRTSDRRALRLSDFITRRALHRTELYQHVYRKIPQEYQLAVQLPSPRRGLGRPGELVGLSLGRARRDFSEGERRLLQALRPHLAATLTRLHELALARALSQDGHPSDHSLTLVDTDGTIAWTSVAAGSLGLTAGERLPAPLRGWVQDQRSRRAPAATLRARSPERTTTVRGRRVRVGLVHDVYPELDALHLMPVGPSSDIAALRSAGLTERQADVLTLALQGHATTQIARMLDLSARTVEKHFERIYARLGVANRTQAVLAATAITPTQSRTRS